jgi:hypothetical protein
MKFILMLKLIKVKNRSEMDPELYYPVRNNSFINLLMEDKLLQNHTRIAPFRTILLPKFRP